MLLKKALYIWGRIMGRVHFLHSVHSEKLVLSEKMVKTGWMAQIMEMESGRRAM